MHQEGIIAFFVSAIILLTAVLVAFVALTIAFIRYHKIAAQRWYTMYRQAQADAAAWREWQAKVAAGQAKGRATIARRRAERLAGGKITALPK